MSTTEQNDECTAGIKAILRDYPNATVTYEPDGRIVIVRGPKAESPGSSLTR